jgi:succinate dehydrogenase/fumarate reductase cytochrome b subunit
VQGWPGRIEGVVTLTTIIGTETFTSTSQQGHQLDSFTTGRCFPHVQVFAACHEVVLGHRESVIHAIYGLTLALQAVSAHTQLAVAVGRCLVTVPLR